MLLSVRPNNNIIVSGKKNSCYSNLNCKLQTRPEDHLTFSYLRPFCSVPCVKNLMLKVFIEILNTNLQLVLKRCMTFADCRLQTADGRRQTADGRRQTADCRLQTADCRLHEEVRQIGCSSRIELEENNV